MCRTPVQSDSFAMYSSTYYLAGSGLTFEIMCFGLNTGRDFNYHLPKAHNNPKTPSSRWTTHGRDKNLNRPRGHARGPPLKPFTARLPQVVSLAHGFAMASPADRTCKLPAWLLPETQNYNRSAQNRRTRRVIRYVQLRIANGAYCTVVRYALPGTHICTSRVMRAVQLCASTRLGCVHTCTEGVIPPVQLYGWSGTVCTCVRME